MNGEPAADRIDPRARALRLAGLAISAVALAGVAWWASRQEAPTLPGDAGQLAALVGAVLAYGLATALRSERWRALLAGEGGTPDRTDAYGLTAVGFMGNNVLPARAGDAMRVYLMAPRAGVRMREVLGTMIAERLLDVVVLLGLFAFLAYGLLRGIDTPGGAGLGVIAAVALAAGVLAVTLLFLFRRTRRGRAIIEFLRPFLASTARLRERRGAAMLALTLAIWGGEATTYLLVGHSVGISISVVESLYLIGVAGVFVLIPSGPGYVGTLDAAVVFGLDAVGEGGDAALSFLIMLRFVLLVPITVLGALLLALRYGGLRAERRATQEVQL